MMSFFVARRFHRCAEGSGLMGADYVIHIGKTRLVTVTCGAERAISQFKASYNWLSIIDNTSTYDDICIVSVITSVGVESFQLVDGFHRPPPRTQRGTSTVRRLDPSG